MIHTTVCGVMLGILLLFPLLQVSWVTAAPDRPTKIGVAAVGIIRSLYCFVAYILLCLY